MFDLPGATKTECSVSPAICDLARQKYDRSQQNAGPQSHRPLWRTSGVFVWATAAQLDIAAHVISEGLSL